MLALMPAPSFPPTSSYDVGVQNPLKFPCADTRNEGYLGLNQWNNWREIIMIWRKKSPVCTHKNNSFSLFCCNLMENYFVINLSLNDSKTRKLVCWQVREGDSSYWQAACVWSASEELSTRLPALFLHSAYCKRMCPGRGVFWQSWLPRKAVFKNNCFSSSHWRCSSLARL